MNEICDIIAEKLGDLDQYVFENRKRLEPEVCKRLSKMFGDIQRYLNSVDWKPDQ